MIHWQTYYQQNKEKLPLHEIMQNYSKMMRGYEEQIAGGAQQEESALLPVVTTDSASGGSFYDFSAVGTVVSDGNSPILSRGFVASNSPNPTLPTDSAYVDPTASIGSFSCSNQNISPTNGLVYIRAFATNVNGTAYGTDISIYVSVCLAEGTLVSLSDGTDKAIEDIDYIDDIVVWNFDEAKFDTAKPLYIKQPEVTTKYNLLEFSDGSYLKTIVQHRIFNKQAGKFTYPMTSDTPIGTITFNVKGEEIILIKKSVVMEEVKYYNVITDYHMNLFGNGILTSIGYNNLYPIQNMKFIKDTLKEIAMSEYVGIPTKYYRGLRLSEQVGISIENTINYVSVREAKKKSESTTLIS